MQITMKAQSGELKEYVSNQLQMVLPNERGDAMPAAIPPLPRSLTGTYHYDGRFWSVPKGFKFPKNMRVKAAWSAWVKGLPNYRMEGEDGEVITPIKPLRKMKPSSLPKALGCQLMNEFRPVMIMMEKAPEIDLNSQESFTDSTINDMFAKGIEYIKSKIEYVFLNDKWTTWNTSYFCKKLKYTEVMKYGTDDDKLRASSTAGWKNRPRARRVRREP